MCDLGVPFFYFKCTVYFSQVCCWILDFHRQLSFIDLWLIELNSLLHLHTLTCMKKRKMCLKTWVCSITYVTNHNSFAVACITINYTDVQNATTQPLNLFFLFFFFKNQQPCSFFRVGEGGAGVVPEGHWLQDSHMAPVSSTFIPNKGKTIAEDTLWCWECFPLQRVQVQHAPVPGRQ